METLTIGFASADAFLEACRAGAGIDGIFIAGWLSVPLGQSVVLRVDFPGLVAPVALRGHVAWRRVSRRHRGPMAGGTGIRLAAAEAARREFLLNTARELVRISRVQGRHATPVHVRAVRDAVLVRGDLVDIGACGAYLRTRDPLPVGTPILLELDTAPGAPSYALPARVAWTHEGRSEPGMGIEFCFETDNSAPLRDLIERLSAHVARDRGAAASLPSVRQGSPADLR